MEGAGHASDSSEGDFKKRQNRLQGACRGQYRRG
jgi:hypothetical protein